MLFGKNHEHINQIDMLNGPLLKSVVLFAVPLAISSILQQLFNSADAAVAGQFIDSQALAAVGTNGPVIGLLINLFVGISVGANVVIAIFVGRREDDRTRTAVHTAVFLGLASGLVLLVVGQLAAYGLLSLIQTPSDVIDQACLYLRIYFVGMPFAMMYNFGSAILRSKGDTRRPLFALCLGCLLNVVLNLTFVCLFGWGVAGIAAATVIANAAGATVVTVVLLREKGPFRLCVREIGPDATLMRNMLKIGVPAGVQGMVFSVSNLCIQSAINGFGQAAIAGSSAALNYELYTYYMVGASGSAAVTFVSQNNAVGNYARCRKVLWTCAGVGFVCSAALTAVFMAGSGFFIGLFTAEPEAIEFGVRRLWCVELLNCLQVLYEIPGGVLRGAGHSMMPAVMTILGTCVLRIVWVFTLFAASPLYETLLVVYPISWFVTGTAISVGYWVVCGRKFAGKA